MAIITDIFKDGEYWVEIMCTNRNVSFFKSLGCSSERGEKSLIRVDDLKKTKSLVTKVCDDCGEKKYNQRYQNIIKNRSKIDGKDRCRKCSGKNSEAIKKENISYKRSLEYYSMTKNKLHLLEEFSKSNSKKTSEISYGTNDEYLWNCPDCKSEYPMRPSTRINGVNCPYCRGFRVNITNCLWTTSPETAKLLWDKNDGYINVKFSSKRIDFKCDICGNRIKNKIIANVVRHGLSCPQCSDGISYPEKFIFSVLSQLDIEFDCQQSFKWSDGKRYDFYIPSIKCIIETNGVQHYEESNRGDNLETVIKNDNYKELLSLNNGIKQYIVIDCRKSDLLYIKENILGSTLPNLFDLLNIDWEKAHVDACGTRIKPVCDLWNKGFRSNKEMSTLLKLSKSAVNSYLKRGGELGWCDYNPKYYLKFIMKEVVALNLLDYSYIDEYESVKQASSAMNTNQTSIIQNCKGKLKSAGGFKWMYKEDYEKRNGEIKQYKRKFTNKPVVRLTLGGTYIDEYESASEAKRQLSISNVCISMACQEKRNQAGGFKWIFKEDYEKYISQQTVK